MKTRKFLWVAGLGLSAGCSFSSAQRPLSLEPIDEPPAGLVRLARSVEAARPGGMELEAHGSEPAWRVSVSESGIVLARPGAGEPIVFPYQQPVRDGGRLAYATSLPEGRRMVLRVSNRPCKDPASGETFPHTAYVRLDGEGFAGCARTGGVTSVAVD
jgi:uncharacterized membrane protein